MTTGAIGRGTLGSPIATGYMMVAATKAVLDKTPIQDGFTIKGIGPAKVDAVDHNIQFNAILDITKDNAKSFGF